MSKVKVLYVKNLSSETTEEELKKAFEEYGKLEKVRKMKDYAFIHFDQRDDAVKAMEAQNGKALGKAILDISLAKPLTDKKKQAQQKRQEKKFFGDANPNQPGNLMMMMNNGNGWPNNPMTNMGYGNNNRQGNRMGNQNFNNGEFISVEDKILKIALCSKGIF